MSYVIRRFIYTLIEHGDKLQRAKIILSEYCIVRGYNMKLPKTTHTTKVASWSAEYGHTSGIAHQNSKE
jgi:hypothetical protein